MPYLGNSWGDYEDSKPKAMKQYFMYGILVSYNVYLETETNNTVDDILKEDNGIQGIFTGRNGDFMIVGKVLKTIGVNDKEPLIVPELSALDELVVKNLVNKKYNFIGEFHYYFIRK